MATGSLIVIEEEDDLLTCSICLETYKTPKYLPCLHTFCKLCIHTYIQSSVEKENINNGFKCPICRTFVLVKASSRNLDCWAEGLPNNHLIISMIDRQAIQKLEKLCNACELSNLNQKAVSWCTVCQEALCSACENCHRKFKVSSRHKILTLEEVKTDKTSSVSGLITCEDHSDKFAEIFCVDHSNPCCTVCATVKHRKCEKVIAIEDAAAGIKETKQTTDCLELLMQWKKSLGKSIQDTQNNVYNVDILGENIFSDIEKLKRDLIEHINKLEKATKEELNIRKKTIVTELTDQLTEMSSLKSTVDNWHTILSTCINDGSDIQCLIEINKLIPKKEKIEFKIKDTTSNINESLLSYKYNSAVEKFKENVTTLGEVSIVNSKESIPSKSLHGVSSDPFADVSLKSTVDNLHTILSTCITDGSEIQCLTEFNKSVPKKVKIESKIKNTTLNINESLSSYKYNSAVEKFKENVTTFGEVSIVNSKEIIPSKLLHGVSSDPISDFSSLVSCERDFVFENSKIKSVGKINTLNPKQNTQSNLQCTSLINSDPNLKEVVFRTGKVKSLFTLNAGDNNGLAVSGIFIKELILLTNSSTNKVLKFNHTGTFLCDVQLNSGPYEITKFREDQIAVSFPNSKEIRLIDIHTLTIRRSITFSYAVCGLRYLDVNDQFVVACEKRIVWSNATSGVKIKETKTSGQTFYICTYKDNSYVYADGSNSVSCSESGLVRFTYQSQQLYSPRGMDMDCHGNLYVCFYGSNDIHQISTSGELIRLIPCKDIGTVSPWFVRFKQNSNEFLVTSLSSGKVVVAEII